jgi:hypothetical protein
MGGWKLAPPKLVDFWNEVRAADEAKLGQPRPLCYIARRQRRKLNAEFEASSEKYFDADGLAHPMVSLSPTHRAALAKGGL